MVMEEPAGSVLRNATTGASTARPLSPLHHRPLVRASTIADISNPLNRRRSSFMTAESMEKSSIRSSADGFLLPRAARKGLEIKDESSHLHSVPLALALLPAIGGLFFKNGSAIITDITLLALAAIFLNWSVRSPWEWYVSAHALNIEDPMSPHDFEPSETIEEESENETEGPKPPIADKQDQGDSNSRRRYSQTAKSASTELRVHEVLALIMCFVSPVLGAWILHAIRSQLSRPSEGLVSNYNLTIFLLGSELRPLLHLIKLIQSRTLHLQRVVANNPFAEEPVDRAKVLDLSKRLDELETHVADKSSLVSSPTAPIALAPSTAAITIEVRKSLQPELDALNRAVRRYEKRTTLLSMQTESRLQDLESRMADAITLAAAAERGHANSRRGSAATLLNWICAIVVMPAQAVWVLLNLPAQAALKGASMVETLVVRNTKTVVKGAPKSARVSRAPGRGSKKAS